MREIWKTIKSNPIYQISNMGRVRNYKTMQILKPTIHGKYHGLCTFYYRIELKSPRKKHLVHRLVADAFIPNPGNKPIINHKDRNGLNNNIDNIEWCDNTYNVHYSQFKKVLQFDRNSKFLNEFNSLTDAALQTNSDYRTISAVCLGKRQTHNGFKWAYKHSGDLFSKRRGNGRIIN